MARFVLIVLDIIGLGIGAIAVWYGAAQTYGAFKRRRIEPAVVGIAFIIGGIWLIVLMLAAILALPYDGTLFAAPPTGSGDRERAYYSEASRLTLGRNTTMIAQCMEMMRTMMGGMMGGTMMGPMFFWMLLIGGLVVIGLILLIRLLWTATSRTASNALQILQERFARGEIDREEYEERRKLLQGSPT
jgi:uncharacterized membrane protein